MATTVTAQDVIRPVTVSEAALRRTSMLARSATSSRRSYIDQASLISGHRIHLEREAPSFERARQTSKLVGLHACRRGRDPPGRPPRHR